MLYLGLKREDYEALKEGKMGIDKDGNLVGARSQNVWKVGNDALMELVKRQKEVPVEKLKEEIMKADPKEVGGLVKKYRIALAMRDQKVDPMDFFVTKVPILPPQFRTAYEVENTVFVSPVNYGYRNLIAAKDQLQQLKELGNLPEDRYAALASRTLNRRMQELMFAVPTGESALEPKGIMTTLTGAGTPKEGLIHGKLFKKRVELSSTGVIQSGPELGVDQVGLPKAMAFELYKPFIIRNLVGMGYSLKDAKEHVKNQTDVATKVLLEEAARRPVIVNRPPSLHKFNVLAMFPVITDVGTQRGEYVVRMNPLVTKGYNADFDGDTVAVHLPATEEARIEAIEKLLPSKNLLKPATREFMPVLRAEFIGAIYRITKMAPKQNRPVRVYTDWNQLYRDWSKNVIATDDLITFDGMDMTVGKALVLGILPRDKRRLFMNAPVDSAKQKQILSQIQNDNQLIAMVINAWKDVARIAMYRHPFTLGLDDLEDPKLNQVQQELKQKAKGKPSNAQELSKLVEQIDNLIRQRIQEAEDKNNLFFMAASGAKGDITQLRQFFVGPVLVTDTRGNPLAVPIVEDYPNGLSPDEYFATTFGARVGMVSKKLGVSEPGAMSKEYLLNVAEMVYVSNKQDPDNPGLPVPTNWPDKDLIDRVLARDVVSGNKVIAKAGEVITPKLLEAIRKENIGTIYIKSLLTDTSPHGVAADSYGLNEYGQLPEKGTNIGILETQAITEPLSQGTLNLFHTGSVAGHKGISNVLDEIKFYTRMPSSKESTAAVLALKAGRVKSINKLPTGGWNVVIENYPHFVPADKQIIVKVGDFVRKGQPITDGPVHPAQLVVLRGPVEARFEIARRLVDIITQSGNKIRMQTVEPLVRAITSTAVVLDPGPFKSVLQEGELTTQQFVDKLNRQAGIEEREVDKAIGYRTAEMYGTVFPGTLIDEDIAKELKQHGFKKVKVYKDVVKYQMVMPGSMTQALYIGNPIASMATGRIKSTISDEAAAASSWNLNVPSQVAEWLVGSTRLL
jgi:DNA-directed RNA polymerase beta' subunit